MKKMERQRRKTKIYKHIHEGTHNCYMNTELMQLQSHQIRVSLAWMRPWHHHNFL